MLLHMQLLHVIHLDCVTKSRYLHYHTIIPFVCVEVSSAETGT